MGQTKVALELFEKALVRARQAKQPSAEATIMALKAQALIAQRKDGHALDTAKRGVQISEATHDRASCLENHKMLAIAFLLSNRLREAAKHAAESSWFNIPRLSHSCLVLQGIVALRLRQSADARTAFERTLTEADGLLAKTDRFFQALDSKGLAYAGLALLGSRENVHLATKAHEKARNINRDEGIVSRVLRLYDVLSLADNGGILGVVRSAAGAF
jgi:hypothetical protein